MDLSLLYTIPYFSFFMKATIIFGILFLFCLACFLTKKLPKKTICHLWGIICIGYWALLVVLMTMCGRPRTEVPQIESHLFWCIKEAWMNKDCFNWYMIVGNIMLFIPLGILLPVFFKTMRKYWKVVCIAFSISLSIELVQLVMHLGLFELDDLFHNTLGCALGYGIFVAMAGIGKKNQPPIEEKWIAALLWILVMAFLMVAIAMGQPVFGFLFR